MTTGQIDDVERARRKRARQLVSDEATKRLLESLRIDGDAACLEIGAGYGSIAEWLASDVAPDGRVLATELADDCIAELHEIGRRVGFEVQKHDVSADPSGTDWDLVHTRFVLEHVPRRTEVVHELASALAPGGWLVVEDAVIDREVEGSSVWNQAVKALAEHRAHFGTDYRWGRSLPRLFMECGLDVRHATFEERAFRGGSVEAGFWVDTCAPAVAAMIGEHAVDELRAELERESGWFTGPVVARVAGCRTNVTDAQAA